MASWEIPELAMEVSPLVRADCLEQNTKKVNSGAKKTAAKCRSRN